MTMEKKLKRVITTHEPLEPRPTLEEALEDMEVLGKLLAEKQAKVAAACQRLGEAGMVLLPDREPVEQARKELELVG
jgi:hypothetical protein